MLILLILSVDDRKDIYPVKKPASVISEESVFWRRRQSVDQDMKGIPVKQDICFSHWHVHVHISYNSKSFVDHVVTFADSRPVVQTPSVAVVMAFTGVCLLLVIVSFGVTSKFRECEVRLGMLNFVCFNVWSSDCIIRNSTQLCIRWLLT